MDENNPPLVLPNGNAYSKEAMEEMAKKNNGYVKDPKTGKEFRFEKLTKAFIA